MKKQLLLFVMILLPMVASADAVEIDGIYYNLINNTAEVTSNPNKYRGSIEIPGSVNYNNIDYSVTSIGERAFEYCFDLTSVTIPNSVTSIGMNAFCECSGLTSVTALNTTPVAITQDVFTNRTNATLYVPQGSKEAYQAADYWKDFGNIVDISIGDVFTAKTKEGIDMSFKVTNVNPMEVQVGDGTNASIDKSYVGKITIPSSVPISDSNLTFSVSQIGTNAFAACNSMNSVEIPGTIKAIEEKAFYDCTNLQKVIVPELDKWCGIDFNSQYVENGTNPLEYAHDLYSDENTRIIDLVIPSSANGVKLRSFYGIHLNSITLPENCTYIGKWAFYRSEIGKVNVLSTLHSVGYFAFAYSTIGDINLPLRDYSSLGNTYYGVMIDAGAFVESKINNMTIPYGEKTITCGAKTYYPPFLKTQIDNLKIGRYPELTSGWSSGYRVPFKDASIKELHFDRKAFSFYAFDETTIDKIYLPEGTEIVDIDMDSDCSTSYIYIPEGATTIKKISGFKHNTSGDLLSTIEIPESVTKIEANAFSGSTFNHLVIPKNIATIANQAFYNKNNYDNYKSVTCLAQTPPTVNYAFRNYQVTLYVPSGCKALYADAVGWKNFTEIVEISNWGDIIPFKDETIKNACLSIGDIDGDNDLSVGEAAQIQYLSFNLSNDARAKVKSFDEFKYFTGISFIYWDMFKDCTNLSSINIPNKIESIGDYAFYGCNSLPTIIIPNNVTNIGQYAFYGCSDLSSVTVFNPTPVAITQYVFSNRMNAILYVPKGSKEAYQAADYWKEFKEIVEIDPAGIDQITGSENGEAMIFTIDGKRVDNLKKGVNVIRMKDGTTRKVVVK